MFEDSVCETVSFPSTWTKDLYVRDSSTQSREVTFAEVQMQSIRRKDKKIQTLDIFETSPIVTADDTPELLHFLKQVEPSILHALEENNKATALLNYDVNWSEEYSEVDCKYILCNDDISKESNALTTSWNPNGSVLVVGYGRAKHEDWCNHSSFLSSWNLDKRSVNNKKADVSIDIDTCVTVLAFHPILPSIVVGGCFNGTILIWDISREQDSTRSKVPSDPVVATSIGVSGSHQEPVSGINWLFDPEEQSRGKFLVISCAKDGTIILWSILKNSTQLKINKAFALTIDRIPYSLRQKVRKLDQKVGITCLEIQQHTISASMDTTVDSDKFFLGTEGGGVFYCSTNSTLAANIDRTDHNLFNDDDTPNTETLYSPVVLAYDLHIGDITSISQNPHHRNICISASLDGHLQIFSLVQTTSLVSIEAPACGYIYDISWSPERPLVFATVTENGSLFLYDLDYSLTTYREKFDLNSFIEKSQDTKRDLETTYTKKIDSAHCLQFNKKKSGLVTIGMKSGAIVVFQLDDKYIKLQAHEIETLNEIAMLAE